MADAETIRSASSTFSPFTPRKSSVLSNNPTDALLDFTAIVEAIDPAPPSNDSRNGSFGRSERNGSISEFLSEEDDERTENSPSDTRDNLVPVGLPSPPTQLTDADRATPTVEPKVEKVSPKGDTISDLKPGTESPPPVAEEWQEAIPHTALNSTKVSSRDSSTGEASFNSEKSALLSSASEKRGAKSQHDSARSREEVSSGVATASNENSLSRSSSEREMSSDDLLLASASQGGGQEGTRSQSKRVERLEQNRASGVRSNRHQESSIGEESDSASIIDTKEGKGSGPAQSASAPPASESAPASPTSPASGLPASTEGEPGLLPATSVGLVAAGLAGATNLLGVASDAEGGTDSVLPRTVGNEAAQGSSGNSNLPHLSKGGRDVVGGGRTSLTQFQENRLVQRVLRGIEQISEGGGQVRIRLHPPELGSLQLTLKVEGAQVSAKLEVENAIARDALVNNSMSLRERLNKLGFEVDQFEVEIRSDLSGGSSDLLSDANGQERRSRQETVESRYAAMQANRIGSSTNGQSSPRVSWFRNGNNLDLTV